MYKHILVPVVLDTEHPPERSLDVAALLADKGARVTVLHVKDEIPSYAITYIPKEDLEALRRAIQADLDRLAARFENGRGVLVDGHSARTILDWAGSNGVDCIIIASHRPGMEDYLLGSTAARVVRHAPCSVHVLR